MEGGGFLRNSQIVVLGVCIAGATIASSLILSQGFLKVMKFTREQVTVTGSAQKDITSDLVVWRGVFCRRDAELKGAYAGLRADYDKVKKYLISRGVLENGINFSSVSTETFYKKNEKGNDTNDIQGYILSQAVEIRSSDVARITEVSRQSTDLIADGVEFSSSAPEYFYTKLDELKLEMLAKATQNAKERAANMVKATGNRIGFVRSARMGVFQITPLNSTEVSDWGVNDTSALEKRVTAVVNVAFSIN